MSLWLTYVLLLLEDVVIICSLEDSVVFVNEVELYVGDGVDMLYSRLKLECSNG